MWTSLIDINYAIRWFKSNVGGFNINAGQVGFLGYSSGGHLAMLAAMRPDDPRYTEIPVGDGAAAFDATVRCVGVAWPVINRCRAIATPNDI